MANISSQTLIEQLEHILSSFEVLKHAATYDDLSDLPEYDIQRLITQSRAAIMRIAGLNSPYGHQVTDVLTHESWDTTKLKNIIGIVEALKCDLEAGYLQSAEELIHGEVFSDFLEMASYLLEEGYKDPAAVVGGASLEGHLRQLCKKLDIEITINDTKEIRPKKTDSLNAEIAKVSGYPTLDQKNVTAWLDLRNKAAHGHYDSYTSEQVSLTLSGIRDFITRNPA